MAQTLHAAQRSPAARERPALAHLQHRVGSQAGVHGQQVGKGDAEHAARGKGLQACHVTEVVAGQQWRISR